MKKPVVLALVVAVLVAAAVAAFLGYELRQARAAEDARTTGQIAATNHVELILSYDYRHLEEDFAAARKVLTGEFAREYDETVDRVTPDARKNRVVVAADVRATSVVEAEPDRVVTLLFVNQTTTKKTLKRGPQVDLNRILLTLEKVDDTWKVSKLDAL